VTSSRWIALDGADNARDLGGLPAGDGRSTLPGRLLRADNLQNLSEADVRLLVDDIGVRSVADLRSIGEVRSEGPGPMTREPLVSIANLSLVPEVGHNTDAAADEVVDLGPLVLPWQEESRQERNSRGAGAIYVGYLDDRADSIIAALRLIAGSDGATLVHCAAGKDRTGVVVALALAEVGVPRAEIVADYAASAERVDEVFRRLASSPTYADDVKLDDPDIDKHRPKPISMEQFLDALDELFGGGPAWMRQNGWTEEEGAALRRKLLD
jgi:protein tyrosine/serine phosphatase